MDIHKSIGTIRKVDELGRIVLPAEMRTKLNITAGSALTLVFDDDNNTITIVVSEPTCTFCGSSQTLTVF